MVDFEWLVAGGTRPIPTRASSLEIRENPRGFGPAILCVVCCLLEPNLQSPLFSLRAADSCHQSARVHFGPPTRKSDSERYSFARTVQFNSNRFRGF